MTNAFVNSATVQIVRQGDVGANLSVPSVVVQAVTAAHVRRLLVSALAAQVIHGGENGEGADMKVSSTSIQIIHSGDGLGAIEVNQNAIQTVYTIGIPESARQRAWTYDFDGHTFYVLDLGANGAMVYDISTGQWLHFETPGYDGHWNMKNGFHWRAGKMVVAGDTGNGTIWRLDAGSFFDDGWRPLVYEVRGVIHATDVGFHRQFALRLIASAGRNVDAEAPVLRMQYSDDNGATWSTERTVELTLDNKQRIEWRSLGAFSHPGRIFRLYDTGGVKFISMVMADVEGP